MKSIRFLCKKTLLPLLLILGTGTFAQDSAYSYRPGFIHTSLLYDFPESYGGIGNIDFPLLSIVKKYLNANNQVRQKQKDLFVSVSLGGYYYPNNYTGFLFYPSLGIRYF